jgi:hypothetical protein
MQSVPFIYCCTKCHGPLIKGATAMCYGQLTLGRQTQLNRLNMTANFLMKRLKTDIVLGEWIEDDDQLGWDESTIYERKIFCLFMKWSNLVQVI